MKAIRSVFRSLAVPTILLALGTFGAAQVSQPQIAAPAAMPAQNSFCGNQPFCYEANDFAATITDFRTSTAGYYKVIDVIVRFQNKTNRPLILAYVAGSGAAMDDRGNRYGVGGSNALRGIGQFYGGNNFDPKFNIPPGGFGDAQFELIWAPGQTVYGLTFELNLTIDEINTVEGNQHTLGGEFPLHYRGLTNGVIGGSQGQASGYSSQGQGTSSASGLPPCGTTATSLTERRTRLAFKSRPALTTQSQTPAPRSPALGSLFGKKKTATTTPTAPTTASAAPCAPATSSDGSAASTLMSPVNGSSPANHRRDFSYDRNDVLNHHQRSACARQQRRTRARDQSSGDHAHSNCKRGQDIGTVSYGQSGNAATRCYRQETGAPAGSREKAGDDDELVASVRRDFLRRNKNQESKRKDG